MAEAGALTPAPEPEQEVDPAAALLSDAATPLSVDGSAAFASPDRVGASPQVGGSPESNAAYAAQLEGALRRIACAARLATRPCALPHPHRPTPDHPAGPAPRRAPALAPPTHPPRHP